MVQRASLDISSPLLPACCCWSFLKPDAPLLRVAPFRGWSNSVDISYGLYVFHLLALALVTQLILSPQLGIKFNFEGRLIAAFLLTVVLAAAAYRWLEQPFLKLKRRFSYSRERET